MAGLKPKGYRFRNDVKWAQNNNGIHIGPIGEAYSQDSLQWINQKTCDSGFTIEMAIEAERYQGRGLAEILGFWDGMFPEPLMMAQWRNHFVVRVRAVDNKKRYREFGADSIFEQKKSRLIQIVSARSKTVIYVDGIRTSDSIFAPIFPDAGLRGRLILGNSATAGEPWSGELYGIALYQRTLSSKEIAFRFSQWNASRRTGLPPATDAAHFFQFKEGGGRVARDCVATGFDLQIPRLFHIIKKQVLVGLWDDFSWSFSYLADVAVNLFGFMPLGFFMALFLLKVREMRNWRKNLFHTVFICFCISLSIELIQVYIPTRDSQLSDLICNTLGGGMGGMLAKIMGCLWDLIIFNKQRLNPR
jgi:Glycopeptide antibiotics resistance protein